MYIYNYIYTVQTGYSQEFLQRRRDIEPCMQTMWFHVIFKGLYDMFLMNEREPIFQIFNVVPNTP